MDEQRRIEVVHAPLHNVPPTLELLGHSPTMVKVRELIALVADTTATVLIRGESGTGKELVARSLRAKSSRRNRAFVKVNCAALPAELLESEMFGFERGAFSGALQAKPGKFEFANHGMIFLDEIGEMPASLQAKLLHVLQDGQFSRLGGQSDVRVDVRIIAATNRRLEEAVANGQFREDLFFRLNVVCITMPPLRDRREEIPTLVQHFLAKYASHYNRPDAENPRGHARGVHAARLARQRPRAREPRPTHRHPRTGLPGVDPSHPAWRRAPVRIARAAAGRTRNGYSPRGGGRASRACSATSADAHAGAGGRSGGR